MYLNECIDSTMGRIHVCFAVLLASDDPRTSWSFQLVSEGRLVIFSRQRRPDRTVGEEPFVYAPFSGRQMPLTLG